MKIVQMVSHLNGVFFSLHHADSDMVLPHKVGRPVTWDDF